MPSASMINESRLFKQLPYFFSKPAGVFVEIAQNAQRAGATRLDFTIEGLELSAIDNGVGASSAEPLLVLADSAWDAETIADQNAAGWGNFFLIAISKRVVFKSIFGSLEIDCNKLLNDAEYRAGLFETVNREDRLDIGFEVRATLKEKVSFCPELIAKTIKYFPLEMTINKEDVTPGDISELVSGCHEETVYQDNKVVFNPHSNWGTGLLKKHLLVVWYGAKIETEYTYYQHAAIEVRKGSPVTPVLPFRDKLQEDEKLGAFEEFLRLKAVEYCLNLVADAATEPNRLLSALSTLCNIADQETLDALPMFSVTTIDIGHWDSSDGEVAKDIIVKKGDPVIDERIFIRINGKPARKLHEYENIHIPSWTITGLQLPKRSPLWLKQSKQVKKYQCDITAAKPISIGCSEWVKSSIRCKGNDILIVGFASTSGDYTVYHGDNVREVYQISESMFESAYNDDGDTYDTQHYHFEQDIDEGVAAISGEHHKYDLLKGFSIIPGIDPAEIISVTVDEKTMLVTLTDAKTVTLNLR